MANDKLKAKTSKKPIIVEPIGTSHSSIDELNKNVKEMMSLFKEASEEMKEEEEMTGTVEAKLEPLLKKVAEIESENKTIAESILALADMIKDVKEKLDRQEHKSMAPPMHKPMDISRPMSPKSAPFKHMGPPSRPPQMGRPAEPPRMPMKPFEVGASMQPPRPMIPQPMGPPPMPMDSHGFPPPPRPLPGPPMPERKKGFFDKILGR